jgi:chromate reductase
MYEIAVFVGSLRRNSINLRLARALERLASEALVFRFPDLELPLYNEDLWADPPPAVLKMKEEILASDAVLFVTPEYNRSTTPVLKNAIDWGSRPFGSNSWAGKPAGTVGASAGQLGTAAAQAHLRTILLSQDVILMGQPEVYFSNPACLGDDGTITSEDSKAFLTAYVERFAAWIERAKVQP